ncbi:hypothetical protein [Paenibacillus flagellatus]|uniref:DUF2269 domain-containing protein n=1 Tax=Paenibacillus flagellatus TaxID=2211139 RepID=A0A2V5K3M1_9BACL|nr:hypothetical protein [Paenibacillus flagellatus]PYI53865.1 hypothetical protein DLM86_15020 [Paenibacillus flagellatus]
MKKITLIQKKALLTLHIVFSGILLGCMVVFLILNITAAATSDPRVFQACYTVMLVLARSSVRASTIGAVVTGVLLSVLTHWGLVRYYWIIAKELLTLLSIGVGLVGIYVWSLRAFELSETAGMNALHDPGFLANRLYLFTGVALQIVSLVALLALSVFKPWGKRAA